MKDTLTVLFVFIVVLVRGVQALGFCESGAKVGIFGEKTKRIGVFPLSSFLFSLKMLTFANIKRKNSIHNIYEYQ